MENSKNFKGSIVIEDFEGVVSVTEVSIGEYTDTVIKGTALRHLSALGRPG